MEDKILCNVSDLEPIADAVREKENTNKLYSVEELKVKVPELISSGSGSIKTCTVKLSAQDGSYITGYAYTAYENGKLVSYGSSMLVGQSTLKDVTLNNVVCDSMVTATFTGLTFWRIGVENIKQVGYALNLATGFYQAPSDVGTIATITAYDND